MNYYFRARQNLLSLPRWSIVLFITGFYPADQWYSKAWYLTRLLTRLKKRSAHITKASAGIMHALMLDGVLEMLTRFGPFTIPVQTRGLENLTSSSPQGKVFCSLHLPLVRVALTVAVRESLVSLHTVRLDNVKTISDKVDSETAALWGCSERMNIIPVGPMVLNKARNLLKEGGIVTALVDYDLGLELSDSIFRLAANVHASLYYYIPELLPDGTILVSFIVPTPAGSPESEVLHQQTELQGYVTGVLRRYGATSS